MTCPSSTSTTSSLAPPSLAPLALSPCHTGCVHLTVPTATLDKYKAAAGVVESVVKQLLAKAVEGANILELCQEGDKLVEEGVKPLYNKAKGTPKGASRLSLSSSMRRRNSLSLPSDSLHGRRCGRRGQA